MSGPSANEQEFQEQCRRYGIDVPMALAVRKALAEAIKSDPDDLSFETPTSEIVRRADRAHCDGWDNMRFLLSFEENTGLSIPDDFDLPRIAPCRFFFWTFTGAKTFGEWCQSVVPELKAKAVPRRVNQRCQMK